MVIDGKKLAEGVLGELKKEIEKRQLRLKLAAVLVGNNPGLEKFIELKEKAAKSIGVDFELHKFPENISEGKLITEIEKISRAQNVDGVLIELPLPKHFDTQKILNTVSVEKDIDVLSEKSQNSFFSGNFNILPPAVEAIKIILKKYEINPRGKNVAVFGHGLLVGKPASYWFSKLDANVSVVDEFTKNPKKYSLAADILISGVGKPGLIEKDMVKEGVTIFDFGYENKDGKIVGDVEFEGVSKKVKLITPVPGGMGPLVVAAVLKNLITISQK